MPVTPLFISCSDLLSMLQEGFSGGYSNSLQRAFPFQRVLILDDYRSERASDWALSTIGQIVPSRINHERFTVVTSNLTCAEIDKADPRIASRLAGLEVINLMGEDRRISDRVPRRIR